MIAPMMLLIVSCIASGFLAVYGFANGEWILGLTAAALAIYLGFIVVLLGREHKEIKLGGSKNSESLGDEASSVIEVETPKRKEVLPSTTTRSRWILASMALTFAYFIYMIWVIGEAYTASADSAEQVGTIIGAVFLYPHLAMVFVAFVFSAVAYFTRAAWASLTAGIFYIVSIVLMPLYFMFVSLQLIFSFIGFAKLRT